ncbi:MAG: hypothetical protein JXB48_00120 [Candidatus Latescibacteria bacterium]|nr:hypothetical protein [Candidatus Latescibacterota bacterium]
MGTDSSSNMLMRPDGLPGTLSSMYGNTILSTGKSRLNYGFDAGFLSHYSGIQFHYHNLDISRIIISRKKILLSATLDYGISRYGDVTLLKGYNQFGLAARIKAYITPSLLFRSEAKIRQRTYRSIDTESNSQSEAFLRLDKFFNTGTTIRGQFETGIRKYGEQPHTPHIETLGFRARIAQSAGSQCGIWIEAYNRYLHHSVEDSSKVSSEYDRVFLDDIFKYSSTGFVVHATYLLDGNGNIQFETNIIKKNYDDAITLPYGYLPPHGWKEWEWNILFSIAYQSKLYPSCIHPRLDLYYRSVDATVSDLSFDSVGTALNFDFIK